MPREAFASPPLALAGGEDQQGGERGRQEQAAPKRYGLGVSNSCCDVSPCGLFRCRQGRTGFLTRELPPIVTR